MSKVLQLTSDKDFIIFWMLCAITSFIVFATNMTIVNIYFLIICILAFISKKDYIWIGLFIFIYAHPGRMFIGGGADFTNRLPYYKLLPEIALGFNDIFPVMYLFKMLMRVNNKRLEITSNELLLIILIGFYFLIGLFYGASIDTIVNALRNFIVLSLYFPITRLLDKEQTMKLIWFVTSIIFLSFAFQLFFYFRGKSFASFLSGSDRFDRQSYQHAIEDIEEYSVGTINRYIDSVNILYLCFISSLYMLFTNNKYFSKFYLFCVSTFSIVIVLLSGTRGWSIGFVLTLIMALILMPRLRTLTTLGRYILVFSLILIILFMVFPIAIQQFQNALLRLSTITAIFQRDLTAGGTDVRIIRGMSLVEKAKESIWLGFGVSDTAKDYFDSDTGLQSLLLQVGLFGYIMLIIIFVKYILQLRITMTINKNYILFIIGVIGMWVMHSTTNILFSLFSTVYSTYWVPFYFGITNLIIKHRI